MTEKCRLAMKTVCKRKEGFKSDVNFEISLGFWAIFFVFLSNIVLYQTKTKFATNAPLIKQFLAFAITVF